MSRARTFADLATASEAGNLSKRNMLVNGNMAVSQRNGTSAVTVSASAGAYTLDRWQLYTNSGNYSVQQITETALPSGFLHATKITVSSVGNTSGSGNGVHFEQKIEADNIRHLNWGGGNASTPATCTLSFWVKSSVTGTYSVHFGNDNDRFYVSTYAISSADTWEKKTITLTGATDGTWNTGNGRGLEIVWSLLQGSGGTTSSLNQWITAEDFASSSTTQWGTNSGATFFLTGVQFELGEVATPFEHESFGDNLARCQRYYFQVGKYPSSSGYGILGTFAAADTSSGFTLVDFPVYMRTEPTFSHSGTASDYSLYITNAHKAGSGGFSASSGDILKHMYVYTEHSGGITAGDAGHLTTANNNTDAFLGFSAEL